jgi:hypothetical protein
MSVVRDDGIRCGATFSDDRLYRYTLTRTWKYSGPFILGPIVRFVGLNPSTADETIDDPTVRRCMGFARDWGAAGMVMLNIFAFRATDPKEMKRAEDPIGEDNDRTIRTWATTMRSSVVACWGAHGDHLLRGRHVTALLRDACGDRLQVLGLTKDGHPKHPLYLSRATEPKRWLESAR